MNDGRLATHAPATARKRLERGPQLRALFGCVIALSLALSGYVALRSPSATVLGKDLGVLTLMVTRDHADGKVTTRPASAANAAVWASLPLTIELQYPGETFAFSVDVLTGRSQHLALYDIGSPVINFSLVSDWRCRYGWLRSEERDYSGWRPPLYSTPATPQALALFDLPPK